MTTKRILVTGASGCIGHYISEALIQNTNHELYLLVRNPSKLQVDTTARPGITILQGDMQEISKFSNLLKTIDTAVLTATSWGGEGIFDINVFKTLELMSLLNPERCEQVIYFSTASVLNHDNQPLKQAGEIGTDYIRSKYDCLHQIEKLTIFPKITTVFPTLVLGGDDTKPYSHLTSGIPEVTKYINIIRFLKADGSFHFIHGQDIATVVQYLIDYPPQPGDPRRFVLGQSALTANQAIEEVCTYFRKKIYFRIPISLGLANVIIKLFSIQMAAWDRFCMNYRHFRYANAINPSSFNLPNYCATMTDVLKISGVKAGK
ncbi:MULTISPECIES: NAD(P)-dependent oxidoreductase [unclassified Anabaena]|uniref:NAD-dependent epimerase/dehydratase family protein n=1 Tax=unclassified Anabaena TaxID=2619674 RepID=UPI00144769EC|nr:MULTISPECIES: NAD(P)-dependent oxidoreductase [unclassified Anabaena]MTJ10993.1 NAD(P)-dependent oxidoreductase [Anabaena sp. UHCC 0204]MTJ53750.1 NAD(P)-dependent oxidoreductase [Anabaena sp. UHCC 0253]